MDFQQLMNVADYNKAEAKSEASIKRYSASLPPPKKNAKSAVMPDGVKRFLEKKKAEENERLAKAQHEKEQLMAIRAQNSKNNKKAKIMASRTKDNDFSKIKLTEDEIESKKKIEQELTRKHLANKVDRMKARIELEEKEKLLPRKRKRKSKNMVDDRRGNNVEPEFQDSSEKNAKKEIRKPKPPPPSMSFSDLLKVAEQKQFEPIEIKKKVTDEGRLLTKKEQKLRLEEEARLKRKKERLERGDDSLYKAAPKTPKDSSGDKSAKQNGLNSDKATANGPGKFKIPKNQSNDKRPVSNSQVSDKSSKNPTIHRTSLENSKKNTGGHQNPKIPKNKSAVAKPSERTDKKNVPNVSPIPNTQIPEIKMPVIDTDAVVANIERKIREKIEKELEAKLLARFGLDSSTDTAASPAPSVPKQIPVKSEPPLKVVKPEVPAVKKPPMKVECKTVLPKKPMLPPPQKRPPPKPVQKRPFHANPYLDPPRRLLESVRPMSKKPPPKRRLESDDDEEEDDDDMSDFIDDRSCQNEEDYSKYIQEIFGYDRKKYKDVDDEDIEETSYAEQQKEEIKSARAGFLEDEEEARLERMRMKRKKLKNK